MHKTLQRTKGSESNEKLGFLRYIGDYTKLYGDYDKPLWDNGKYQVFSWLHCLSCIQWNVGLGRLCHSLSRILSTYPWNISQTLHQQCIKDLLSCSEGKVLVVFRVFLLAKSLIGPEMNISALLFWINLLIKLSLWIHPPINVFCCQGLNMNIYLDLATKLLFSFTLKWWMDVPPHRRGPL